jgi:hypothetical protein
MDNPTHFFLNCKLSGSITNNQLTKRRSQICHQVPLRHDNNNGCRLPLLMPSFKAYKESRIIAN